MAQLPIIKLENKKGDPIQAGDRTITPISQAFTFHLKVPFYSNTLVYNHPVAVLVQQADQPEQKLPIVDVTRLAWLGLMGAGFLFMLLLRRK